MPAAVPPDTEQGHSPAVPGRGRIVLVNTADRGSGAETLAWLLLQGLRERGRDAWLVVGARHTDDPRVMPLYLSPHVDYRPHARWWRRASLALARAAGRQLGLEDFAHPYSWYLPIVTGAPPAVLHCHNLHGGWFDLRALAPLSQQFPTFLTVNDCWPLTGHCSSPLGCPRWETGCGRCPDLAIPPAIRRDATWLNWRRKAAIFRRCRLYVAAPSQWVLNRIERSLLRPAVIDSRVIPNGVDLTCFRPGSRADARLALNLPADENVAVFAAFEAATNPRKDYATVREAVVRLARQGLERPLRLVIAGDTGPVERLGPVTLEPRPFLPQGQLARLFQAADLLIHAAREEAFGLVLAEAMACGTPVVATATGGIPEVVRDGQDGLLTPPGDAPALADAVRCLLEQRERRAALGRAACIRARTVFDGDRITEAYLAWYDQVRAATASTATSREQARPGVGPSGP